MLVLSHGMKMVKKYLERIDLNEKITTIEAINGGNYCVAGSL